MATAAFGALGPAAAQTAPPASGAEPLERLWSRPLPKLIALALAADGSRLLAGDLGGSVRCYDNQGSLRWQAECPNANRLLCSTGGLLSMAFARRQPLSRRVFLLDRDGNILRILEAGNAIQAADVAADGTTAVFAAGKELTFCSRSGDAIRTRSIVLPGEPSQLELGPADSIYVSYGGLGRLDLVKSSGRVLWSFVLRSGAVRNISASADGKYLAVATRAPNDTAAVSLLDWQKNRHWTEVRGGRLPRVRICADGSAVLLTYEHKVEHGAQKLFERRLAYLSGPNGVTWTKGGGYTAPLLVSVAADGNWVVALDRQREAGPAHFRLYGRDGGRLWMYTSPESVLIAASSQQGRHFAVYRADGVVELVHVTAR